LNRSFGTQSIQYAACFDYRCISRSVSSIERRVPRVRLLTLLSFAAIYLIWGSTFLAIRVAVETVPPLLAAGVRFFLAGAILFGWARASGGANPSHLEWRNICIQAAFLFLISYGGLFWAEKTLASGIASVLVSTIPVWTALLQIAVLRKESFRWSLVMGIGFGVVGVAVLAFDPNERLTLLPCLVILMAAISWSTGTVLSKILLLPKSMPVNSGAQMLTGGLMILVCSGLFGEWSPAPQVSLRAGLAILYLAVAGSIVAFTAYVWLLNRLKATVVTSYAYVNPVVALIVGHWFGGEPLGMRTILGAGLVLLSVVVVMMRD
jgi:drug/metabolite transporter (DMT)-like permease